MLIALTDWYFLLEIRRYLYGVGVPAFVFPIAAQQFRPAAMRCILQRGPGISQHYFFTKSQFNHLFDLTGRQFTFRQIHIQQRHCFFLLTAFQHFN